MLLLALSLGDGDLTEDFEGAGAENWERVVSDAHPPYNIVERVHDPKLAKSGNQYLHFRTLGGSTAVRRAARQPWPAEAGRPYRASVWVRLSGNRSNSTFLSLTWVNAAGDVLAEQRSEPVQKTDGWTLQMLEVSRSPVGATGVLPGLHFEGPDVRGACDFDLLQVVPAELLGIRPAGRSMATFTTDEYSRFTLSPAGLPPGIHSISATMTSPEGKVVHRSATIDVAVDRSVAIDFPPLPSGIHELRASVDGHEARGTLAVLVGPPDLILGPSPQYSGSAERLPESAEDPLQRHLLDPRRRVVLDRRFFDPNGQPNSEYLALKIVDQVLAGAEPMPDPGLFPTDIRLAAFRKGRSVLFAVWSDDGERDLTLPIQEGTLLSLPSVAPRAIRAGERIRVNSMPLFILDVDPVVTELRVDLSASELPLQLNPVRLSLRIRNRSQANVPRDLQVSLEGLPAGWRASNRRFRIAALPADSVHEETFDLIAPPSESERAIDLRFDLSFTSQGKEVSLQALRQLTLKSPIRIESGVRPEAPKTLSFRIANGSDHTMTLSIRSRIPGLAERLDLIRDLAPGSRTRPFDFPAPESGSAEILVLEAGGDRAVNRCLIPLR